MSNLTFSDDLANISDDQLKKRLKDEFNYVCGPITATTKSLYVKKLESFLKNSQDITVPVKTPTTPKNRRKTLATPVAKEESPKPTRRASVGRSSPRTKLKPIEKEEIKVLSNSFKDSEPEEIVSNVDKNIYSSNGTTALSYSRGNKLLKKSFSNRLASNLVYVKKVDAKNESLSSDESTKELGGIGYSTKKTKKSTISSKLFNRSNSITSFSDSDNDDLNIMNKKETKSFTESFTKRLLRHRPKNTVKNQDYDYPKYLNSQNLVTQVTTKNDKNQLSDIYNTQSNYISYFILITIVLFLVFIFSFYFFSRYYSISNKEEAEINKLEKEFDLNIQDLILPECLKINETDSFCSAKNIRPVLMIIKEIKSIVDKKLNDFYCSASENTINPFEYSVAALRNQIELSIGPSIINLAKNNQQKYNSKDLFLSLFANALDLLAHNSKWHLKPFGDNQKYDKILVSEDYPKLLSSGCQFKLFLIKTFWYFTGLFTVSLICFLVYLYLNHLKKQILKEKELLYELVEKSIELLQSTEDPQSLPILHIRDMLLNPSQRKSQFYQKIWDQVVNFIENNESRIKSSIENIDGEDFKTWKWVATNTSQPDSTVMRASQSEFQNNAFNERNQPKINSVEPSRNISTSTPIKNSANVITSSNLRNFVALTEFLKVRNMVDQETRKSSINWKNNIKRLIIQKCCENPLDSTSHGLLHIHIDDRNVNDGLIYIKCESIEKASNAFKALHGWWCDNKLISVKFLKEERYYSRFPDAIHCNEPLSFEDD